MAKVDLKKAMTGLRTFVNTRGEHFSPNGREIHSRSCPNQSNLRYFQKLWFIGMWGKASLRSIPTQNEFGFNHSQTCLNVSILNLYFLTELLKVFKLRIGLNFPGERSLGTAKYALMYSPSSELVKLRIEDDFHVIISAAVCAKCRKYLKLAILFSKETEVRSFFFIKFKYRYVSDVNSYYVAKLSPGPEISRNRLNWPTALHYALGTKGVKV